jgi:hypothetical protein
MAAAVVRAFREQETELALLVEQECQVVAEVEHKHLPQVTQQQVVLEDKD